MRVKGQSGWEGSWVVRKVFQEKKQMQDIHSREYLRHRGVTDI